MNTIFITVRTTSSRLPNKCLKTIGSKRVIDYVIERAKLSKKANQIVLCTTIEPADNILESIAHEHNIKCYRGSVLDKLNRWYEASKRYNATNIVTFDADDPLCDPYLIDLGFSAIETYGIDFIDNAKLVCGSFTFAFTANALKKVNEIKNSTDTEMMWTYFTETGYFKCVSLTPDESIYYDDTIRLTLDYEEDFELFHHLLSTFPYDVDLKKVISYMHEHEELKKINFFRQNDYKNNQQQHIHTVLK